ncbi:hypothetical protein EDD17DRAFT_1503137 [Pisolithus thermaeus]|nr:hypothetical protein EDD17DRAFT_1503137 [Pisolithus thermaeus]
MGAFGWGDKSGPTPMVPDAHRGCGKLIYIERAIKAVWYQNIGTNIWSTVNFQGVEMSENFNQRMSHGGPDKDQQWPTENWAGAHCTGAKREQASAEQSRGGSVVQNRGMGHDMGYHQGTVLYNKPNKDIPMMVPSLWWGCIIITLTELMVPMMFACMMPGAWGRGIATRMWHMVEPDIPKDLTTMPDHVATG